MRNSQQKERDKKEYYQSQRMFFIGFCLCDGVPNAFAKQFKELDKDNLDKWNGDHSNDLRLQNQFCSKQLGAMQHVYTDENWDKESLAELDIIWSLF